MADVYITAADLSCTAAWVAWATLTVEDTGDRHQLWIDAVGGEGNRPTVVELPGPAGSLAWSPRGDVLAAGASIDGVRQIVLIEPDGTWRQLTNAIRGVAGTFSWSPDGSELAAALLQDTPPTDPRVAATMDGMGAVAKQVSDIHLIDAVTGASKALTDGPTLDRAPAFFGSGEQLFFCRSHSPDTVLFAERPLLVDRKGVVEALDWRASANSTATPAPDGRMVLCSSRHGDRPRGVPASLYVRSEDGSLDDRTAGLDLHLMLTTLSDQPTMLEDPRRFLGVHGADAIVGICRSGAAEVVRVALDGPVETRTLLTGDRGCHPLALRAGQLLFSESTMHGPSVLRLLDLGTGVESTIVDPNPSEPNAFEVLTLDVVSHGDAIQTWFLQPAGSANAGPLPTVLIVHGGPYESFGHSHYLDAHLLVAAGYGVLMMNPRGSIGYGAEFATAVQGQPSVQDFDDVMAATDRAVELGLADADRLAVCGLSYGGYMSAHLAARTSRFRAAVIENPLIDMRSFRPTSDIGVDLLDELVQGTPDAVPERYREFSPLHHAEHCRTPSLLILGEADLRCPASQGLLFRDALRRTGCPTEVVWLPGASHIDSAVGPPEVRQRQDQALLEWMQRHNPV